MATVIASYFFVKNIPDQYVSTTQIATGIVDASRHLLDKENSPNAQQDEITREFSNLTEIIKLKKLIDNVSYQLIIHDLSSPGPFRSLNHQLENLNAPAIANALVVYRYKLQNGEPLSLYNKDESGLNQLLISMKYDERSLRKNLNVERDGESDFITISFISDNPRLSAFVVNTLCKEFIDYYAVNVKQNESNAIGFLSNLLTEKRNALNEKKAELQQYKIKNGILNLDDQSKAIYTQILAYSDKKMEAQRTISSYDGAIKAIADRFDPKDRKYIESTISQYNQAITSTEDRLRTLNEQYVHSGFNPTYKPTLDSLQKQLAAQINNSSDKYITNPLVAKDDLVKQKMSLEVSRDLASYSIQAIDKELNDLYAQKARLVPFDATVKTYEFDIDIASKEYLEVLNKYNTTNVQSSFSIKPVQVEPATPDIAEPSKKIPLIVISGLVSLFICLLVLFIIHYLDNNIKEPADLVSRTQLPLLGSLNLINGPTPDLKKLWDVENREAMKQFKELLRSVRFEIDQELKGEKILAVTSLGEVEGKTLLITSLAYSYSAINKKVLLIDGNFNNPEISESIRPKLYAEDYFRNCTYIEGDNNNKTISVLGNRGGDVSILEINDERHIQDDLNELKLRYDIILIDLPPLNSLNKSKEWILFANKTIAVFEADKNILQSQDQHINYLKSLNGKFAGWVLNKAAVNNHSRKTKNHN
ncbi:MAG TPA: lipopolysaccharide biosynthesis protein [Mucilaginibacter sp.]